MAGEAEESMGSDLQEYKPGNELLVVDCTRGWEELTSVEYPGMEPILLYTWIFNLWVWLIN